MWRISSSLKDKCCYRSQKVSFCDCVRASICEIYRNGKKVNSAYIGENTRIIYRSESSRMVYFIQISAEMWHFEESGQVIFHKMINSFFPELFKRWHEQGAHHVVTIILFTSVDISSRKQQLGQGEIATNTRDYFRVVVDQVHISQWSGIMETLRYEFSRFDKDVLLQEDGKVQGKILPAVKGNLLQAISIASSLVSSKFIDRDLRRTGVQTLVITPGTGIFDVDYDLMYQTSLKLLSVEIGVDLVCLSRAPLHVTPLFRYKDKTDGSVKHCVPSWLDISYWSATEKYSSQWIPRCKIFEIQMMGVMENEVSAISIDYLPHAISTSGSFEDLMNDYDNNLFTSASNLGNRFLLDDSKENGTPPDMAHPTKLLEAPSKATVSLTTHNDVGADNESSPGILIEQSKPRFSALTSLLSHGVSPKSPQIAPVLTVDSPTLGSKFDRSIWGFTSKSSTSSLRSFLIREEKKQASNEGQISTFSKGKANSDSENAEVKDDTASTRLLPKTTVSLHASAVPISNAGQFNKAPPSHFVTTNSPNGNFFQTTGKRTSFSRYTSDSYQKLKARKDSIPGEGGDRKEISERHSMWMTILNPSNVPADKDLNISNYGKWQFVYPKKVKRRSVKWRSLRSPASLPLMTSIFPSWDQFRTNYRFQIYDATLYQDQSEYSSTSELMHEMIAIRLAMGFQIISKDRAKKVEANSKPFPNPAGVVEVIPADPTSSRIYMSMGTQIHRLACDMYGTINVQMFTNSDLKLLSFDRKYHPFVKTRYETKYKPTTVDFFGNNLRTFNWNQIDQILTGFEEYLMDDPRMYRIRLVLLPVDVPISLISKPFDGAPDRLNAEEIRLEGLKKLLQIIHRGRYYSREEGRAAITPKQISASVPEIKFYTGDIGTFLLQLKQNYNADAFSGFTRKDSLFIQPTERFTRFIRLPQLGIEMQAEKGVKFFDRRWHWKMHYHCFTGSEFVTWLLSNFTDIETPEDAVEYGNHLMQQGLFHHVEHRHTFLNGHYFYQLNSDYVTPENQEKQAWFASKRPVSAGDSTASKTRGRAQSSTSLKDLIHTHQRKHSGNITMSEIVPIPPSPGLRPQSSPAIPGADNQASQTIPKVLISRSIRYNVDMAGRSKRPEVLTFHVDRVHNPENCYQLRLEWLNTTPKLIDEAIISIGRVTEQYGLKLVQVPIQEISQLPNSNPFASLFKVRFALDPVQVFAKLSCSSTILTEITDDTHSKSSSSTSIASFPLLPSDPLIEDPLYFHKYVLKSIGYFLDVGPISESVSKCLDVQYSWGKPFYRAEQYIHRSGLALVQIMEDGEFVFMTNFLAASRVGLFTAPREQLPNPAHSNLNSEHLLKDLRDTCADEDKLRPLFLKAKTAWATRGRSDQHDPVTEV